MNKLQMAPPSKIRYKLRKMTETQEKLRVLSNAGAKCENCTQYDAMPHEPNRHICNYGTDFHGYQMADSNGLCTIHTFRRAAEND